jgi:hypothetical protein
MDYRWPGKQRPENILYTRWENHRFDVDRALNNSFEIGTVQFEPYTGPLSYEVDDHEMPKLVSIFRSKREYTVSSIICIRKEFPITVLHHSKSQALDNDT